MKLSTIYKIHSTMKKLFSENIFKTIWKFICEWWLPVTILGIIILISYIDEILEIIIKFVKQ